MGVSFRAIPDAGRKDLESPSKPSERGRIAGERKKKENPFVSFRESRLFKGLRAPLGDFSFPASDFKQNTRVV
jgi:hypothetical protein